MARHISVNMADELDAKVGQLAEHCRCTYTDALHHLLWRTFQGFGRADLDTAKRLSLEGKSSKTIRFTIQMSSTNYRTDVGTIN